ncbi:type II toxin-antitoxin system HicB family antitoxin [Adlercreutzia sp. ZJ473]|uniref:type II toxin-antitoxin system HicB family antitoxin n=1 Tax=Adlercreutzia sp. ZJ473 TaxID=2722822 RepID=UPI001555F767|nr:type II toxin-antitoxin system HicB family antitoxin [Adlercreutzia sp. ZJ473]
MKKYLYEAVVTPWSGGWEAEFPDLGICTQGADLFDAAFMAQDLLALWISQALREGRALPEPRMDHEAPEGGRVIAVAVECSADEPDVPTMTVQEAADALGISTARIHALIRDGILGAEKVGSARLVSTSDVMDYFNSPRSAGRPKKAALA